MKPVGYLLPLSLGVLALLTAVLFPAIQAEDAPQVDRESLLGQWGLSQPRGGTDGPPSYFSYETYRFFADGAVVRLSGIRPGIYYIMQDRAQAGTWKLEGSQLRLQLSPPVVCGFGESKEMDFRPRDAAAPSLALTLSVKQADKVKGLIVVDGGREKTLLPPQKE